jgi:hypothetical protein
MTTKQVRGKYTLEFKLETVRLVVGGGDGKGAWRLQSEREQLGASQRRRQAHGSRRQAGDAPTRWNWPDCEPSWRG